MEYKEPLWYTFLLLGSLLSAVIAYPTVAIFATRPIQRKLRLTQQDYLSDWVKWPFQTIFYTLAVLVSFTRWRHENNRHMIDAYQLVHQAATPLQRRLCLWLAVSNCTMVLLIFMPAVLGFVGIWPVDSG